MIGVIENAPPNVAAFRAFGKVDKSDYDNVLIPEVDRLVKKQDSINFLLLLDTDLTDFTMGAILKDLAVGLKHFSKWHKMAIVSGSDAINKFTDLFSYIAPGESKGFKHDDLDNAIEWVSK